MKKSNQNETMPKDHVVGQGGELHQVAADFHPPMTNQSGTMTADDETSLKAGTRGASLIEDFLYLEKTQHFDQERIPERIVHARGVGAHGFLSLPIASPTLRLPGC